MLPAASSDVMPHGAASGAAGAPVARQPLIWQCAHRPQRNDENAAILAFATKNSNLGGALKPILDFDCGIVAVIFSKLAGL